MAKKKAAKKATKKTPSKTPSTRKPSTGSAPSKPREVDPNSLEGDDAKKRVAAIYKLEKVIEGKRAVHDVAKRAAKAAKAALTEAEEAMEQELHEQRFGPGPLFPVN